MNRDIWISVLLSIPVGLVTGLLVAPIQNWYKGWGKTREAARLERITKEYLVVLYYKRYPQDFTHYLISLAISGILYLGYFLGGMLVVIGAGIEKTVLKTLIPSRSLGPLFAIYLGGAIVIAATSAKAAYTYGNFRSIWIRVKLFDEYVATVPDEIRNPEVEKYLMGLDTFVRS